MKNLIRFFAVAGLCLATLLPEAKAGVFSIPHFIPAGNGAIGLEPEVTLTNGAGVAGNLKYTHGLNDLQNANFVIGTGSGPRKFRVGGGFVFDFFPDIEGQPGIGVATEGIYYRLKTDGQFELTAVPYIHKNFVNGTQEIEPFLSVPIGMGFKGSTYSTLATIVIGCLFRPTLESSFRYVMELGVQIQHTESYVSGGIVIYP